MQRKALSIDTIPAILWGPASETVYLFVHGRFSRKEEAEGFAAIAERKGSQVISFDLPEHGERKNEEYPLSVQNAVHDLRQVSEFVVGRWRRVSLFGSSLGAYFSLVAYRDLRFGRCLLQSPILDMEKLIQEMMKRAGVTEEALRERQEILTPAGEVLSWPYYEYVKENPIVKWMAPTYILYGANDELTPRSVVDAFVVNFQCKLEVVEGSGHYFHTKEQIAAVDRWLELNI